MTRLTDSDLAAAIDKAERGQIEAPLLRLRTSLDDNMSRALLNVLYELRERRASDLTDEEREALKLAREVMHERASMGYRELSERAVVALDRILAAGGGR